MVQKCPADGRAAHVALSSVEVDRAALDRVAHVTETKDAFKIALRQGQALDDLELALLPILPVESVRIRNR